MQTAARHPTLLIWDSKTLSFGVFDRERMLPMHEQNHHSICINLTAASPGMACGTEGYTAADDSCFLYGCGWTPASEACFH